MVIKTLKNYAIAAGIGLATLVGNPAKAEVIPKPQNIEFQVEDKTPNHPALEALLVGAELAASKYAYTAVHETGHAVVAKDLGVGIEQFHPYPGKINNIKTSGYVSFNSKDFSKLSDAEAFTVDIGGMVTTRMFSEKLDKAMDNADLSPRTEQALAALYLLNRADAISYFINNTAGVLNNNLKTHGDPYFIAVKPFLTDFDKKQIEKQIGKEMKTEIRRLKKEGLTEAQIERSMENIYGNVRLNRKPIKKEKILYSLATGALIVDALLDWKEISTNVDRLLMNKTEKERENYHFNVILQDGGVKANFLYEF